MSIAGDLIRGHTDAIILARLLRSDSYGYEINKTISTLSSGRFELKEATLYTAFKRLEDAGFIASYWGGSGAGMNCVSRLAAAIPRDRLIITQTWRIISMIHSLKFPDHRINTAITSVSTLISTKAVINQPTCFLHRNQHTTYAAKKTAAITRPVNV